MSALKYWIWLSSLEGVSVRARAAVIRRFGDAESDPGVQRRGLSSDKRSRFDVDSDSGSAGYARAGQKDGRRAAERNRKRRLVRDRRF